MASTAAATTVPPEAAPPARAPPARAPAASSAGESYLLAVVGLIIFGFFATAWLSSAANAAVIGLHWAYGEGSRAAAAAKGYALFAPVVMGLFLHALLLGLLSLLGPCCGGSSASVAGEVGMQGGAARPAAEQPRGRPEITVKASMVGLLWQSLYSSRSWSWAF
ncbi:hypothetical protein ACP4OV_016768 [Aristida adscensionis]